MAIGPKEKRDKQLRETKKLADFLESKIDQELRRASIDRTLMLWWENGSKPAVLLSNLSLRESVHEELRQRYVRKGWKDVQFKWTSKSGEWGFHLEVEFTKS